MPAMTKAEWLKTPEGRTAIQQDHEDRYYANYVAKTAADEIHTRYNSDPTTMAMSYTDWAKTPAGAFSVSSDDHPNRTYARYAAQIESANRLKGSSTDMAASTTAKGVENYIGTYEEVLANSDRAPTGGKQAWTDRNIQQMADMPDGFKWDSAQTNEANMQTYADYITKVAESSNRQGGHGLAYETLRGNAAIWRQAADQLGMQDLNPERYRFFGLVAQDYQNRINGGLGGLGTLLQTGLPMLTGFLLGPGSAGMFGFGASGGGLSTIAASAVSSALSGGLRTGGLDGILSGAVAGVAGGVASSMVPDLSGSIGAIGNSAVHGAVNSGVSTLVNGGNVGANTVVGGITAAGTTALGSAVDAAGVTGTPARLLNGLGGAAIGVGANAVVNGVNTAGVNTAGVNTAGVNTAGVNTAGVNTAVGNNTGLIGMTQSTGLVNQNYFGDPNNFVNPNDPNNQNNLAAYQMSNNRVRV